MATASATDSVLLPSYWSIALNGLDLQFTHISGMTQSLPIAGQSVSTEGGGTADSRTVGRPSTITLQMSHVLLTSMDLWTKLAATITARAGVESAMEGTLSMVALGTGAVQVSWALSSVYLNAVAVDPIGPGNPPYLTATVSLLVGSAIQQ